MAMGISLHIGLNAVDPFHYGWKGILNAAEADAEAMHDIARSRKFTAGLLTTRDATRKAVLGAARTAAQSLSSGDIFLLTFSGHGGQLPDLNGDEATDPKPDFEDETWCLFDGQLIDDELHELWAGFPAGTRIVVVSDSCHSGTAVKALAPGVDEVDQRVTTDALRRQEVSRSRAMPSQVARDTFKANLAFYTGLAASLPAKPSVLQSAVHLLAACQDEQEAGEGTFNGLFTAALLQVWGKGSFAGTYESFNQAILGKMPNLLLQRPNHYRIGANDAAFDGQKPFTI